MTGSTNKTGKELFTRLRTVMAAVLLPMALTACVTQPKAPAPESQASAVREVVADMKFAEPFSFNGVETTEPSRLVALSSLKVSAFSPAKAEKVLDAAPSWFQDSGLDSVEECAHCKAQGNIVSISSEYGKRRDPKRRNVYRKHQGIDIRAPQGSGALAFKGGEVIRASRYSAYGLTVEIRQYDGVVARYAHLSKIGVKEGEKVDTGAKVGEVGRTGRTTGSHLHFELIRNGNSMNPMKVLARTEQIVRCLKLEEASR